MEEGEGRKGAEGGDGVVGEVREGEGKLTLFSSRRLNHHL